MVAAAFLAAAAWGFLRYGPALPQVVPPDLAVREWVLVAVIAAAVAVVLLTRVLLLAICALGIVGAGLALVFLSFGAPDLALTQLLVETLTVVIVSIILLRLPGLGRREKGGRGKRLLDSLLAAGTGAMVTTLLLAVLQTDLDRTITEFYEKKSYVAAHGKNIVNVILVDFRSLDTLGEITVVAAAGLAAYALIRNRRSG
jgi:multicomponent Na+:H+ antiporter subunit A